MLSLLLLSSLILISCTGRDSTNRGCSEGDHCMYYTGNRGIITMLERPPRFLHFRSSDIGELDSNFAEFNLRIRNDGVSDSYGGVFFSGVSPEIFEITRIDEHGERPVNINRIGGGCFLDFFNIRDLTNIGSWSFIANCAGIDYVQYGRDRSRLNIDFRHLVDTFGPNAAFLQGLADAGINIGMTWGQGELTQFNIGANFGLFRFGRALMTIVSGLDFETFGGASFYLQGDNPDFPGGGIDFKTFRLRLRGEWPAGQDYYHLPYNIRTCYAYTTFVSPMICIDPDPFSDERKTCTDFTHSYRGSQGAPIAVTRVQSTNTGREVILQITIRNVGTGDVWDVGYLEHCSPYFPSTVRPSMKNVVYIGFMHIDNKPLDCANRFRVLLDPKTQEGQITCRYELQNTANVGSAYSSPLRMELWYGYEENIRNQITVRRIN